jgi:hypothetical protein
MTASSATHRANNQSDDSSNQSKADNNLFLSVRARVIHKDLTIDV